MTSPLEERREIVRDLIKDRDLARHKTSVVRHRSGLSDLPPPAAPTSTALRAEDIVREAPIEGQSGEKARESEFERVDQDRTQFDDGTLNDFIRRLKQDTTPVISEEPLSDTEPASEPAEDEKPQSWRFMGEPAQHYADTIWQAKPGYPPLVLSAFAPSVVREDGALRIIRLAADESGFFCSYLGWMVAWSTACLDPEGEAGSDDETASADVDDNQTGDDNQAGDEVRSPSSDVAGVDDGGKSDAGTSTSDRRSDAAGGEAVVSEDIDDGALLPVTGALDRLRDLLRSRGRPTDNSSSVPRSLSFEAEKLQPPVDEGPPLPASRPEVAKDVRIVRNNKVFDFTRTPTPAFKPVRHEPATVIFPPEVPRRAKKAVFTPAERPTVDGGHQGTTDKVVAATEPERHDTIAAAKDLDEAKRGPASSEAAKPEPATTVVDDATPEDPSLFDRELILFEPGSAALPLGIESRLGAMLEDAKTRGGKLYIVSQASVGTLAMERARGVGLALVRLGATADLIEYEIAVSRQGDQVDLLSKADEETLEEATVSGDLDKVK